MHRRAVAVASSGVSKKAERGEKSVFTPIYSIRLHGKSASGLIRTFYALPTHSYTGRRFSIRQQPHACILVGHLHCCHH
jgi:hypothetical protein